MIAPITYKQVLDKTGAFVAVELWQGNQHITIDFRISDYKETISGHHWNEVREIMDGIKEKARIEAVERAGVDVRQTTADQEPAQD